MNKKKKSIFSTGKKVVFDLNDALPPWDRKIINTIKRRMYDIVGYTEVDKIEETLTHYFEILVNTKDILSYSLDMDVDAGENSVTLQMDTNVYTTLDFTITPIED